MLCYMWAVVTLARVARDDHRTVTPTAGVPFTAPLTADLPPPPRSVGPSAQEARGRKEALTSPAAGSQPDTRMACTAWHWVKLLHLQGLPGGGGRHAGEHSHLGSSFIMPSCFLRACSWARLMLLPPQTMTTREDRGLQSFPSPCSF